MPWPVIEKEVPEMVAVYGVIAFISLYMVGACVLAVAGVEE